MDFNEFSKQKMLDLGNYDLGEY